MEGAAQTLAAGAVGPHHLLQVLADRVLLCRLLECLAGGCLEATARPCMHGHASDLYAACGCISRPVKVEDRQGLSRGRILSGS